MNTIYFIIGFLLGVSAEHGTGDFYGTIEKKADSLLQTVYSLPTKAVTFIEDTSEFIFNNTLKRNIEETLSYTLETGVNYFFSENNVDFNQFD